MRVLVTGSRGWTDKTLIRQRIADLPDGTVIVTGGARGVDSDAKLEAEIVHGFQVEVWKADWGRYGKKAGPIRNLAMLNSGVDLVLAFWDGESRGTQHCISAARVKGIPVEVISP